MSEHMKEPAIIGKMYSVEHELSEGYETELCDNSSWVIARLSGPFQKKQAERIKACVNACLSMSDPEVDVKALQGENDLLRHENITLREDVKALVEALLTLKLQVHADHCNPHPMGQSELCRMAELVLARLRREP